MTLAKRFLTRLGLARPAPEPPDAFALRLDRIHRRESRRKVRQALFRNLAPPLEA